jgi:hypothetical protein
MPPVYPLPWKILLRAAAAAVFNRPRSFHADAMLAVRLLKPPLVVFGTQNIPENPPFLVTINHYSRQGFHAWWLALSVTAALDVPLSWVITSIWRFQNHPLRRLFSPLSRWVLGKAARVYGFLPMPAMPPDPAETAERAAAVRRIIRCTRQADPPNIGLAPEGYDAHPTGMSIPPGVGRMVAHIARAGYQILPVAVYEQEGLVVRIGESYRINQHSGISPGELDQQVGELIRMRIVNYLPAEWPKLISLTSTEQEHP